MLFYDSYEQGQHDGWSNGYHIGYMLRRYKTPPKNEYFGHLKYVNPYVYLYYSKGERKQYNKAYFKSFEEGVDAGIDQAENIIF